MSPRSIVTAAILGTGLPVLLHAQELSVDLSCEIRDYDKDLTLDGGEVLVTLRPPSDPAQFEHNRFRYQKRVSKADDVTRVTLEVEHPPAYGRRTLALRRLPTERRTLRRELRVYMVPEGFDTSYTRLAAARQKLDAGQIERALALFEYAFDHLGDPQRQYSVKVRYNYAETLLKTCERHGYDTCEQAAGICAGLEREYESESSRRFFDAERITAVQLKQCQGNVAAVRSEESHELVRQRWADVEEAFHLGGDAYHAAAEQIEGILTDYDADPTPWIENGKPKWTLMRDAGVSYLKYADHLSGSPREEERTDIHDALTVSINHLKQATELGDSSPTTAENLRLAEMKLRKQEMRASAAAAPP